ncbi:MAG: hypothetical protein L6Q54_13660 [Leptospiraceae bacterium]|nr:hypothetical protein [Leptospiraceae bacterium]MCK6382281.1 hypothetical protein [Leptospiraceae bacterium]NUM41723.1 hypothetical protein [Leptospiraceae bacterium]
MNRTTSIPAVDMRSPRNLPKEGFGMAITKEKSIYFKVDNELNEQFESYLKLYQADKSQVARFALKKFLEKCMPPVNVKKGIVKTT